jgi:hypothetical protein
LGIRAHVLLIRLVFFGRSYRIADGGIFGLGPSASSSAAVNSAKASRTFSRAFLILLGLIGVTVMAKFSIKDRQFDP